MTIVFDYSLGHNNFNSLSAQSQTKTLTLSQVSTTVETFQDLSLPIPSKEDLAKLHSSIHQNLPVKTGASPDSYNSQGWISYIMESIRRSVSHAFKKEAEINIFYILDSESSPLQQKNTITSEVLEKPTN